MGFVFLRDIFEVLYETLKSFMKPARSKTYSKLIELIDQYHDDDKCRRYLETVRWPEGVKCLKCSSTKITRIHVRNQLNCASCKHRFSVTTGTIFNDSHLPLWKWFVTVYLMIESRSGVSANHIRLNVGVSYKTAWYLCHRIRSAMNDVQGSPAGTEPRTDRIAAETSPPAGDVGEEGRSGGDIAGGVVGDYIGDNIKEKENGPWVMASPIASAYRKVSTKHIHSYQVEHEFLLKNRENPRLFYETLKKLVEGEKFTFRKLVEGESSSAKKKRGQ
jgi:transposase-like protein